MSVKLVTLWSGVDAFLKPEVSPFGLVTSHGAQTRSKPIKPWLAEYVRWQRSNWAADRKPTGVQ